MQYISNHKKGWLYSIGSGLCYGLLGYFGMTVLNFGLSVANMLFWRFLIAGLFISFILLLEHKNISTNWKDNIKMLLLGSTFFSSSATLYY